MQGRPNRGAHISSWSLFVGSRSQNTAISIPSRQRIGLSSLFRCARRSSTLIRGASFIATHQTFQYSRNTVTGGVATPMVIDFGIAKAITDQRLTDKTVFTSFEMLVGTPAYMSPEQAELSSVDVDTRTDIYSLGVLLYELLTSSTPFETEELLKAGLDEIRRVIREQEPLRPSTRLSKMAEADLTTIAQQRRSEPPQLIHIVRGDLDWIAMKALEKDRTRRYETANDLALDVKRFLENEPVLARPPSRLYKFLKTVQRNKLVFLGISLIAIVLVTGLIVLSTLLRKERQARQQSQLVTPLLEDMIKGVGA